MEIQQPTTPTNNSGEEAIRTSSAEGYVVGDGTTDRVLVGFQKNGFSSGNDYGIKVSQSGFDVKTATNAQLIMSSAFNSFKIVLTGTTTLSIPTPFTTGSSQTATIPHGITGTPTALAFVNIPSGSGVYGTGLSNVPAITAGNGLVTTYTNATTDATNLYLKVTNIAGVNLVDPPFGMTWTFRYYILQETATT